MAALERKRGLCSRRCTTDIVLASLAKDGTMIAYAATSLEVADIVLMAVRQNALALKYADGCLIATERSSSVKQHGSALEDVEDSFRTQYGDAATRHNISQLCRKMTPTYHCATFNETLFERKCLQARCLVFQTKTRGRRASQGVKDTTTVHNQSSRNLSRFRLPVLQIQLSEQNFFLGTNVCRQLRHRRLTLLEFLLQMAILPHVSIDSNATISETC